MASHVLVPFDDSDPARRALAHAIEEFPDADVTVLTVIGEVGSVDDSEDFCRDDDGAFSQEADERLTDAEDIAAEYGVSIETECAVGPPTEKIPEYAEAADVDHVVIGNHGRTGLARLVVGSVAENVASEVSKPVTTVQ